jgi:RNA-directed DNA polymerase
VQSIAKQGSDIQAHKKSKWDWVESGIWTDRMLAALENGVKGNKWFSLWDKVHSIHTLRKAWEQVNRNKGAAGVDRVSIKRFTANCDHYLSELAEALKEGRYEPLPIKRVHIPKGDGKTRPLGIPAVKDRIVQAAVVKVIEPIFENEFLDVSYGFRPGRGCKDALRRVDNLLKGGNVWVVDADIQGYFDNIPWSTLQKRVEEKISDGQVLKLVDKFLKQLIMEELNSYTPTKGTPQGAVLSPLLANIYLHPLDKMLTEQGYEIVRYADDFVILCGTQEEAEIALGQVRRWMQENGLTLHPDKTHLGNCLVPGEGFEFLGYRFESGNRYVRKKSMTKLRDAIRGKTKRSNGKSIEYTIETLNPMLKGWFEYFKHAHEATFRGVDGFVRRRLRSILRRHNKQSEGTGRCLNDHLRWPNKYFAERGLFTLQTARALACQSR